MPIISSYTEIDEIKRIIKLTRPLKPLEIKRVKIYIDWLRSTAQLEGTEALMERIPKENNVVVTDESGKARKYTPIPKYESGKDRKHLPAVKLEATTEAWVSDNARDVANAVHNNQVTIRVYVNDNLIIDKMQAFFLVGRTMLVNFHYCEVLDKQLENGEVVLEICPAGSTEGTKVRWMDIRPTARKLQRNTEETDLVVLKVEAVNRRQNLMKHIITKKQLGSLKERRVAISSLCGEQWHLKFGQISEVETTTYNADSSLRTATAIKTNIGSVKGDCGAVYILDDSAPAKKICGFHFAGGAGQAYATPLVYEDLKDFDEVTTEMERIPVHVPELEGNFTILGKVQKGVHQQSKSKIVKTRMFNEVVETSMMPAKLDYTLTEDSILVKAMRKNFGKQELLDEHALAKAVNDYQGKLSEQKMEPMRVLTFEEAVQGIEGDELIRGIDRTTSAGFPYAQQTKKKGKQEWFGEDEWTLESEKAQEMKTIVQDQVNGMVNGRFVEYIFTDTLKDETRPIDKVMEGKTRLFAAAPMDFIIVFRMYFMSFLAWMMRNRIRNESAVGIKAHSMEWHELACHLKSTGKQVIAGDFSNYDGTLHHRILWRILDMIEEYYRHHEDYDPRDTVVRRIIWENVVNSTHICGQLLYRLNHSQPSGNPATAVLNSIYNSIACRYTWYASGLKESFSKHVSMIAYGDDNVLSMSAETGETFNQEVMTYEFAKIGMIYTDEAKSGKTGFRSLEEVKFLKRSFRKDDLGIMVAPLTITSILECFNWIHKTHQEEEVIKQNFVMANIEFALHEQDVFDKYMDLLQRKIQKAYGWFLPITPRELILLKIRDEDLADQMINWV